jgi:excinuclease ABC subunit C
MKAEVISSGLQELKNRLHLPKMPRRIECYDVSNIQGTLAVGSMVVLEKGWPKPAHYRRFRIKTVSGANDYAMIQETLRRRFKRGLTGEGAWGIIPDLVLIDGGRVQLNAALGVRQELELDSIPIASLAKEKEEVFIPGDPAPICLPTDSPALHILQRARDEAHRFAISYHRKLRRKEAITSALDNVPGIGPKRKRALLKKFGSVEAIKGASAEELSQAEGITLALAKKVKEELVEQ